MTTANEFYVYTHHKQSDGSIFYVGKGKGNRAHKFEGRNNLWNRTADKHGVEVRIIATNLTQQEAFDLEVRLIEQHGRININTGSLVNFTDGGEGVSGAVHSAKTIAKRNDAIRSAHSKPEYKAYCSERNALRYADPKARQVTSDATNKMYAERPEVKNKLQLASTQMWSDEKFKQRMSDIHKQRWESTDKTEFAAKMSEVANRPGVRESRSNATKQFFSTEKGQQRKAALVKATKERCAKQRKPILCVDNNMVFSDQHTATKWVNDCGQKSLKSAQDIVNVCKGKGKTAGGYRWAFADVEVAA